MQIQILNFFKLWYIFMNKLKISTLVHLNYYKNQYKYFYENSQSIATPSLTFQLVRSMSTLHFLKMLKAGL